MVGLPWGELYTVLVSMGGWYTVWVKQSFVSCFYVSIRMFACAINKSLVWPNQNLDSQKSAEIGGKSGQI